ncbi:MAG: nucleotidyltransferase domain-containing protein [Thermomicrobiales bacterium]
MTSAAERYERMIEDARADPGVVGVVLSGSRGKGFGTEASDYDVCVVVRDDAPPACRARYEEADGDGIDAGVMALGDFTTYAAWGSPFEWDRYGFAHAAVPVDKTGQLRQLVDEKGRIPEEEREPFIRTWLDAYINGVYRSLKCVRNGNRRGARLEAADALGYALTVIFAIEGRHRPYFGYLEREPRVYPLQTFPLDPDELLAMIDAVLDEADVPTQQRLLAIVDDLCRPAGFGDVFDGWGADYQWMQTFRRA